MPDDVSLGYADTVRISSPASRERRRNRRHDATWSASLVFDPRTGLAEVQTSTQDVSVFGACVLSDCPNLCGEVVGVLLRPTLRDRKARPVLLTVLARVVSSVPTSDQQAFRYGLSFIRPLDDIEQLALSGSAMPASVGRRIESSRAAAHPH